VLRFLTSNLHRALPLVVTLCATGVSSAQDLEPRRWTHLPVGASVAGLSYVHTEGTLQLDPATQLTEAKFKTNTLVASYAHWFKVSDYTGRVDLILPFQDGHWDGKLAGSPVETSRTGFSDPWVRFTLNLVGSPPLKGPEYVQFRAKNQTNTVVGVGWASVCRSVSTPVTSSSTSARTASCSGRKPASFTRADLGPSS
jgi:hypothetical protein